MIKKTKNDFKNPNNAFLLTTFFLTAAITQLALI
jgi:hypothetical protein